MITYDDFAKLDIRIGKILSAEKIPEGDKLLKLVVDVGEEERQILAGMAEFYDPEYFVGKYVPVLINLEPRTLRGYESQGMILAAGADKPVLMSPIEDVPPGSIIK